MVQVVEHCELKEYNTFGIEAKARVLATYSSEQELQQLLVLHKTQFCDLPLLHIGSGSNLLFMQDFNGMILHSQISDIKVLRQDGNHVWVRVGAGMLHDDMVQHAIKKGWYGMENLSLIPGQVGASAVQNIGAYGVEICDLIDTVRGIDLHTGVPSEWNAAQCAYGYRQSIFKGALKGQYAITYVTLRLDTQFVPNISYGGLRGALQARGIEESNLTAWQLRRVIVDIRQDKLPDPAVLGNAGSFFMNSVVDMDFYMRLKQEYPGIPGYEVDARHVKVPAGWLIEQCGWKGRALGPAAVHHKQALVLVNLGGATGADVLALCKTVQHDVHHRFGIEIQPEVNFIV